MSKTDGGDTSATPEKPEEAKSRSLKEAIKAVKTRIADQQDVVVDLGESERARLELLAAELRPLFEEIDETDERFEFAIATGERPRLWIDMTSFVAMGHDTRSYRFIKDTRMGRIVRAETSDMSKMADFVGEYIAEKVVERERMIEGEWIDQRESEQEGEEKTIIPEKRRSGFFWFVIGLLSAFAIMVGAAFLMVPDAF